MKQVAEQLIEVMKTALEAKKAGQRGNFQGILNQVRQIFDTNIKSASGSDPSLTKYIVEAQRLQIEGARTAKGTATTAAPAQEGGSTPIDMAAAFDFQKKRNLTSAVVAVEPQPRKPTEVPAPDPVAEFPDPTTAVDPDLLTELAGLTGAKLRERMGGIEGLKVFARELFGLSQDEGETEGKFSNRVLGKIKDLKRNTANV